VSYGILGLSLAELTDAPKNLEAEFSAAVTPPPGYAPPLPTTTAPAPTPESGVLLYAGLALAAVVIAGGAYLIIKEHG